MDQDHLRRLIKTVLDEAARISEKPLNSPAAIELLMGTAAQESHMGKYLYQLGNGPARGIFQIEPATEKDIYERIIVKKQYMRVMADNMGIRACCGAGYHCGVEYHLAGNLPYQIIIARLKYWSIPAALPEADDIDGLARYWKKYYNTELGRGTVEEFKRSYSKYCE